MHRLPTGYAQDIDAIKPSNCWGFLPSTVGFLLGSYLPPIGSPLKRIKVEVYDSIGTLLVKMVGVTPEATALKAVEAILYNDNEHIRRISRFIPIAGFDNFAPILIEGHDGKAEWDRMMSVVDDKSGIPRLTDIVETHY